MAVRACTAAYDDARQFAKSVAARPYKLPQFDSIGERSGDTVRFSMSIRIPELRFGRLRFVVSLNAENWDDAILWLKETVAGFFSQKAKLDAQRTRERKEYGRRRKVLRQAREQWDKFCCAVEEKAEQEVQKAYDLVLTGLNETERRLEEPEQKMLNESSRDLKSALDCVAVKPILFDSLVRVFEDRRLGRIRPGDHGSG